MARQTIPSIDQQIARLRNIQSDWGSHTEEVARVRHLEQKTMMVSDEERKEGYYTPQALQGYRQLLRAYQALHPNLDSRQQRNLDFLIGTSHSLEEDYRTKKYGMLFNGKIKNYAETKMAELERRGEVYLQSGHNTHFNITRIRKTADGYTYTLYDAGHESEYVRSESNRNIINAVREYAIKPRTDIRQLIETDARKLTSDKKSDNYKKVKNWIENALEPIPIRTVEDYGQRRRNCTTRGQRILMQDVLQDPKLSKKILSFIRDVDDKDTGNIKASIDRRLAKLEEQRAILVQQSNVGRELLKKTDNTQVYEIATRDSQNIFRTKPGVLSDAELMAMVNAINFNSSLHAQIRESNTHPGKNYLYIIIRDQEQIPRMLPEITTALQKTYPPLPEESFLFQAFGKVKDFIRASLTANAEPAISPQKQSSAPPQMQHLGSGLIN